MSGYLLDTNQLSVGVRQNSHVAIRIDNERKKGRRVGTCIPALCELETGLLQVRDPIGYRVTLQKLLRRLRIWPMTLKTAGHFGEIHRDLKQRGRAFSQIDIMLAALCRELDLTLVTIDQDFAALPWLKTENWTS
jgi:predicted nucleic acid-binding protein